MSKARLHRVSVIATLDEFVTIKPFLCQLSKFHASCEFVYLKASLNQTLLKVIINGGASFRWSFGPLSVWDSIESTTILTTHPSLLPNSHSNHNPEGTPSNCSIFCDSN